MMIVVRGKRTEEMDAAALAALAVAYAGVTIDVGAGDGRFAYRYAQQHPERFVIGMDPVAENMAELAAKAARKPARGGLANVLYVVASIERVPDELRGIADEIYVTLPWGSLMRGLILADDVVLAGLASLAQRGAALRIVLNTRIPDGPFGFDEPVPVEARDLPEPVGPSGLTPDYVRETLAPSYNHHGIYVTDARFMSADEVARLPTTWAKRLSHRAPPRSVYVECVVREVNG